MEEEAGGAGLEHRKKENGSASNIERRRGPNRQLRGGGVKNEDKVQKHFLQ